MVKILVQYNSDNEISKYINEYYEKNIIIHTKDLNYVDFSKKLFTEDVLGKDLVILSLNDVIIDPSPLKIFNDNMPNFYAIVIVMHPLEFLSRIYSKDPNIDLKYMICVWKQYADILLKKLSLPYLYPILYDKFIKNDEYRKNVVNSLGIKYDSTKTITFPNESYKNKEKKFVDMLKDNELCKLMKELEFD